MKNLYFALAIAFLIITYTAYTLSYTDTIVPRGAIGETVQILGFIFLLPMLLITIVLETVFNTSFFGMTIMSSRHNWGVDIFIIFIWVILFYIFRIMAKNKRSKKDIANQKGFILPIIIAVVVVALLGGAGYFAWQNYSAPEVVAPTENTADQTAGWQTYTNTEYGFEIKYPNDFYTNPIDANYDQNITDSRLNKPFELDSIKYNYKLPNLNSVTTLYLDSNEYKNSGFQFAYFNIAVDQNASDVAICQNIASGPASSGMSQKTPVSVNGQIFYRYKIFDDAMGGQRGAGDVYFRVVNNKCFVIHGFHAYRDSRGFSTVPVTFDDSEILRISEKINNIVNTFKFINN
ncbi:MAG: hypothetical protein Q8Q48_01820 [Candidatus Staskawiczbacteria bacterium]|nr:hypothetical protein [Candidatus Staskawiczbacteria bacterium]